MDEQKVTHYSQASLQDYSDCKRRFYYRYLARLSWPAVESEPVIEAERLMQAGKQFHRVIRQYLSGVPVEKLERSVILQEDLSVWWNNFKASDLDISDAVLYPEKVLTARVGDYKLVGKYDLLALHSDERVVIYDWKTSRRKPTRTSLSGRWQTILYPYLLAAGGSAVNQGSPISASQISMVYWFANFPDQPVIFKYSDADMESDSAIILSLIEEIESQTEEEDYTMTPEEKVCKYCVYRSLCDRGTSAGDDFEIEFDSETEIELDFDQIQEIEF